ncbi:ABC transporter substrate binding protein, partial [Tissierella praeacuta DSM 18095]
MKKSKISKLVSLAVSGIVFLSGCNSNVNNPNSVSEEKIFKIGISQLADHPALDDARLGFEDGLKELGINAEIDYQNAQGDIPTTMSISQKFIKDKVDLIYAIATPAAQSAKQSTNDIPILFSAVT